MSQNTNTIYNNLQIIDPSFSNLKTNITNENVKFENSNTSNTNRPLESFFTCNGSLAGYLSVLSRNLTPTPADPFSWYFKISDDADKSFLELGGRYDNPLDDPAYFNNRIKHNEILMASDQLGEGGLLRLVYNPRSGGSGLYHADSGGGEFTIEEANDLNIKSINTTISLITPNAVYINKTSPNTGDGDLKCHTIEAPSGQLEIYSTTSFNGKNIKAVDNIDLNTINGMGVPTIGLTWADFNGVNAYNSLPSSVYNLDNSAGNSTSLTANGLQMANLNSNYYGIINILGSNTVAIDSSNGVALIGDCNQNSNKTQISVNDGHREIDLNCVDILTAQLGTQFSVLSPNYTSIRQHSIYYSGGNTWQIVDTYNFNIPDYTFSQSPNQQWKYEFFINCYNMDNQSDKQRAIYIEILDSNGHSFTSYCFNNNTPFTRFNNNSAYPNQSENYGFTDFIDLNGISGSPLTINLWWYGDSQLNCEFLYNFNISKTNVY
jgi:hypothetical protein